MKRCKVIFILILSTLLVLFLRIILSDVPLLAAKNSSYFAVTGPCNFHFPRDDGPHPGYKTEWWYYTGNIKDPSGKMFGFQLTFFRQQLNPPGSEAQRANPVSPWRTDQIYVAHVALTDISHKKFYHAEDMARGVLGIAGAIQKNSTTKVFVKKWFTLIETSVHRLHAETDAFSFDLSLIPKKPPVAHGRAGYSVKGSSAERASCYYSLTRLRATGYIVVKKIKYQVSGVAWMDHEFTSAPLEKGYIGWDWFSLQLSNETELMLYLLRLKNGKYAPASSGTFIDASGSARHLLKSEFAVRITRHWKSPHTEAMYPAGWEVMVPSVDIDLFVEPNLSDQEILTPHTTQVNYWEGSISAKGVVQESAVSGVGYVELTGYDRPLQVPEMAEGPE